MNVSFANRSVGYFVSDVYMGRAVAEYDAVSPGENAGYDNCHNGDYTLSAINYWR